MTTVSKNPDGTYDLPIGRAHVGAEVLEIISGALYTNPLDVVREYIQNAVDGHATQVRIEVRDREIILSDNGTGMDLQGLDDARKVAITRKRRDAQVGFRGIGIYSSFSVCDHLEIITRPAIVDEVYRLQFSYEGMRRQIEEAREGLAEPASLIDILEQYTSITDAPSDLDLSRFTGSFTMVRLVNPTGRFSARLTQLDALTEYLVSTVPLDFPDGFEHAAAIRETLAKHIPQLNLIRVIVSMGDHPEKLVVQPSADDLLPPATRFISDPDSGRPLAFLWACLNRERKAVKPSQLQGFLARVKGFAIGDRQFLGQLWGRRGHGVLYPWYTGEVYVLDPSIAPTAERSDFEESAGRERLYNLLRKEFERLERLADKRRDTLVAMEKVARGQAPPEELTQLRRNLEDVRQELWATHPLDPKELLDEKGKHAAATAGQPVVPSTPPQPPRQPTSKISIRPSTVPVAEPPPEEETIAQTLLALAIRWPPDAEEVVGILDNTLQEDLDGSKYWQCARDLRKKLETWEQGRDQDDCEQAPQER